LITLSVHESIFAPVAAQLQAVMVHPFAKTPWMPDSASGVLVGPGLAAEGVAESCREFVNSLWRQSLLPVIADASSLRWLPAGAIQSAALRVITPHPGEAARMLGVTTPEVQADRPSALRALSQKFGDCFVLLKGCRTLVGRAGGEIAVNLTGNPHLAQGGSGDLLAGYVAGLLAQPALQSLPLSALRYAVWEHGAAADRLLARRPQFTIEDLAGELGGVLAGASQIARSTN
jgi:NAD(P)H-hydrate epimerase